MADPSKKPARNFITQIESVRLTNSFIPVVFALIARLITTSVLAVVRIFRRNQFRR